MKVELVCSVKKEDVNKVEFSSRQSLTILIVATKRNVYDPLFLGMKCSTGFKVLSRAMYNDFAFQSLGFNLD